MARKIQILDTTLRDGNKLPFVVLSVADRVALAIQLERLGVDVIEAGFPVSSPDEEDCVSRVAREVRSSSVSALARALPGDVERTLRSLEGAARPYLHVFMPCSPESLAGVVKMSESRALEAVRKCVGIGAAAGVTVQFSLSEAPQAREGFRNELCLAAREAGARVLNLADTGGVLLPADASALVAAVRGLFPAGGAPVIGVHCHNDLGLATANSLAALEAGAGHVEVTVGGFGERAGNAALEEIALIVEAYAERLGLSHGIALHQIAATSRLLDAMTGVHTHPNKPVIGRSALPAAQGAAKLLSPQAADRVQQAAFAENGAGEPPGGGPDPYRLESFSVLTGSHAPPVGIVVLERESGRVTQSSHGSGPIDALFKAVDRALGFAPRLVYYSLYTLSTGPDAEAEVTVTTELKGRRFHGHHRSADVIEASLRAYMRACNEMGRSGLPEGAGFYVEGEYLWE
jgi:isopropylmalate/homocitrate/citramalate synthase